MHWSPSRTCCRPWTVASCPVTGTWPLRLFFFSTEITELAMPSLATSTPLMSLLAVSICSKIVPAWALSQSGTAWFGPLTNVPSEYFGSSTELYPCAKSVALLMSYFTPAAWNAFSRYGRSLPSQRADVLLSGRITPTNGALPPAPPELPAELFDLPHAARPPSTTAPAVATARMPLRMHGFLSKCAARGGGWSRDCCARQRIPAGRTVARGSRYQVCCWP